MQRAVAPHCLLHQLLAARNVSHISLLLAAARAGGGPRRARASRDEHEQRVEGVRLAAVLRTLDWTRVQVDVVAAPRDDPAVPALLAQLGCVHPPLPQSRTPAVNGDTARSFSTHVQRSAAKGSSATVSRSDFPIDLTF
jgi:hypothetical protein